MADELVTLTINGREVTVPKGTLVVEAARSVGIEIPIFCYHPKLKPVGACRMCLVEIEKMPRLQTACTTPVADGMVVRSDSPGAITAQNGVIELLLANHPLDCPICDKGGECPLQDNAFKYGLGYSRMTEEKRHLDKAFPLSDRIVLDKERCIMCYRCVRFQSEIPGDEALAVIDRGAHSEIGTLPGETFDSPFSGNTIEICPVGALTSRQYRFRARPWDLRRTPSVCVGCAVGCNIELHARDGRILRMVARENPQVDDGWLCDMGRFETLPPLVRSASGGRPLVRWDGKLEAANWDEALARTAELLTAGPAGVLAWASLTNEAVWTLAGPLRAALPGATFGFWPAAPPWPLRGAIANLPNCTRLLVAGLDPWTELPILALWLRKAALRGGRLVAVGPRNGLFRDTAAWLRVPDEQIGEVLRGLLAALGDGRPAADPSASSGQAGRPTNRDSGERADEIRRAAAHLTAEGMAEGPAALLAGPRLAADPETRALLEQLAARLGAKGSDGMVGSPALSANGRGVQELAGDLAADAPQPPNLGGRGGVGALLLVGPGPWQDLLEVRPHPDPLPGGEGTPKLVLATNGPFDESDALEVVLPLAHPYEQAGSLTNLEGRVQQLEPSGFAAPTVLADWTALARLAAALGASVPTDLPGIRAALAEAHPAYAKALGGLPAGGRLLEPAGAA